MSTTKILLDRSVFNGDDFARLKAIPFKALDSAGVSHVLITPMLVGETLDLWLRDGPSAEVREHLQFILEITKGRWFNDPFVIFRDELCSTQALSSEYHLLPSEKQAIWKRKISEIVAGRTVKDEQIRLVTEEVLNGKTRGRKLKELCKQVRNDIAGKIRITHTAKLSQLDGGEAWNRCLTNNLDGWGRRLIVDLQLCPANCQELAITRWLQHKEQCPYFTDWVKGWPYILFYAAYHQNSPLDKNAQADVQHLIYLRHADVIVSEEKGFMKQAFVDLYESQGKQYWNVAHLENFVTEHSQLCKK